MKRSGETEKYQRRLQLAGEATPVKEIESAGITRYLFNLEGQRYNVLMRGERLLRIENEIVRSDRRPQWRMLAQLGGIHDKLHRATLAHIERSKANGSQEN